MSDDLIHRASEALVDVAPGPWEAALEKGCHGIVASIQDEVRCVAIIGNAPETPEREPMRFANARFIAAARDLVPEMADRLEAQEALLREAMEALGKQKDQSCEGFCADLPQSIHTADMDLDCGVCSLRATLAKLREHLEGK